MKKIEVEGLRGNILLTHEVSDSAEVEVLCDLGYEDDVALMVDGKEIKRWSVLEVENVRLYHDGIPIATIVTCYDNP